MIYGREKAKVPVTAIHTPIMPKVGMEDDGKWQYIYHTLVDWIREDDKRKARRNPRLYGLQRLFGKR